jgi:hypothetical protein
MGAVESPAGEALRNALLAWQDPPCDHPRVSEKAYAFYGRGPAPLLAHQCLSCGEPVSAEDAVRRRLES